ncbi:serine protease easter-like isoform X2 [Eupeodes corollae]|nr:serine protease easter-like isoform X2 [Eupeodes corollae]
MISKSSLSIGAVILVSIISATSAQIYYPPDKPSENVVNYGRCLTPNSERALCIHLEQCTYLYNKLLTKPLLDADKMFLQRSQCGSNNGKVLICCPERQIGAQMPAEPDSTDTRIRASLPEPGTCGNVISNRIYGGNVTKIDEYPWMALIEYKKGENGNGHHCGGSLINDRYVLTAAHCISAIPETWTPYQVRLGEWDTQTDVDCEVDVRGYKDCADPHVDVTIEKVIPHEKYVSSSKSQPYDIALIRLSRSIPYTEFIQPICLPLKDILKRSTFEGSVMDVSGWGKTEQGTSSNLKLKAEVPIVPLNDCQRVYSQRSVDLQSSQMCAGGQQGIDSCRGDSGGPLIGLDSSNKMRVYYFLAGVVSFGPTPCGLQGWPGVYTKVSDYVDWIQQNIEP